MQAKIVNKENISKTQINAAKISKTKHYGHVQPTEANTISPLSPTPRVQLHKQYEVRNDRTADNAVNLPDDILHCVHVWMNYEGT